MAAPAETYDVVVVGGGIGGSVAARFAAQNGLSTLLLEKDKTPRNKPCSGIQFLYLERLVGERIPREALCTNELSSVQIITPSGKAIKGRMKMLNFWRSTFDSWLNRVALQAGATFRDEARFVDFTEEGNSITVAIQGKENEETTVTTRYLIGADGLNSAVRRKLRPQDFKPGSTGATINYYFVGEADLDPETLYMFYNREFSPLMFAWVYMKDSQWVVGTGADKDLLEYAERFLNHVQERYRLRGQLIRKEGFSTPMESTVCMGRGRVLLAGDAAGLVDLYRGLGMDNAALSARLAAKAIVSAVTTGRSPVDDYQRAMRRTVQQIEMNAARQAERYATDKSLEESLSPLHILRDGLLMLAASQANKLLPAERIIKLPM